MKMTAFGGLVAMAMVSQLAQAQWVDAEQMVSIPGSPVGYFTFASDADIVLRQDLRKIAKDLNGNLMLGGDASYPDVSSEFVQVMRKADALGASKHVYLEGPGGPTGSGGIAGDECKRMIARARKVGISIDRTNCGSKAQWVKQWNSWGWWSSSQAEIKYLYDNFGAESFEIDNLYRAGVESSASVVKFLKRFQVAMQTKGLPVSILLKNMTVADLNAIKADLESSKSDRLHREYLSDFAISEEDFKSQWSAIKKASKKIGIVTVTSSNTYNYQARGYWK